MLELRKVELCPDGHSRACSGARETWLYPDGSLYGYAASEGDVYRIELPDVATFLFDRAGGQVTALRAAGVSERHVRALFAQDVLPVLLQASGLEVLHASAVHFEAGVVAFCAASGTGKSTLAFALSRRGHALCGDDFLAFESGANFIQVRPLDLEVRLRPEPARWFGEQQAQADLVPLGPPAQRPLAAVLALKRRAAHGAPRLQKLGPAAALTALLPHAYCFSLQDAGRKRLMMEHYLDLVATAPVCELEFSDGLENLPEVCDTIEHLL